MGRDNRDQIFISYSHQDQEWVSQIRFYLEPLLKQSRIDLWDDTMILPGMLWREEIAQAIARSKFAIVLVSSDYLASKFIGDYELPTLLHQGSETTIIPVLVRSSALKNTDLARYHFLNTKPLSAMDQDEVHDTLLQLTRYVYEFLEGKEDFDKIYSNDFRGERPSLNLFFEAERELEKRAASGTNNG